LETRFVAIYRWRIAPDGPRLHRDASECYVAIALCPPGENLPTGSLF
jgi:hypothetical protein